MTGDEARKLVFEGHWVRRKMWTTSYSRWQVVADFEHWDHLIDFGGYQPEEVVIGHFDDGTKNYSVDNAVYFKLTFIDYQNGELFGAHGDVLHLDEEEWLADDWEVFDLKNFEPDEKGNLPKV